MKVGDLVRMKPQTIKYGGVEIGKTLNDIERMGIITRIGTYGPSWSDGPSYEPGSPLIEVLWLTENPRKGIYATGGTPPSNMSYEIPEKLEVVSEEESITD